MPYATQELLDESNGNSNKIRIETHKQGGDEEVVAEIKRQFQ